MHHLTSATAYPCEGSVALSPQAPKLTLIEGGLSSRAVRPELSRGELLPRQLLALLVSGALVIVMALLASWASDVAVASATPSSLAAEEVVVTTGDSLWGIAEGRSVPGMSTAALVAWIEEANDLSGTVLTPGQRIVVPTGDTTTR